MFVNLVYGKNISNRDELISYIIDSLGRGADDDSDDYDDEDDNMDTENDDDKSNEEERLSDE